MLRQSHALPWGAPHIIFLFSAGQWCCLGPESLKPLLIYPEAQSSILPMYLCLYPGWESSHGLPSHLTFMFRLVHSSTTQCQLCGVCLLGNPEPAQKKKKTFSFLLQDAKVSCFCPTLIDSTPTSPHFPWDKSHKATSSTGTIISQDY